MSTENSLGMTPEMAVSYLGVATLATMTMVIVRKFPRSRGRAPPFVMGFIKKENAAMGLFHLAYFLHAFLALAILPENVKTTLFSPIAVILLGTVFPVMESIRAATTIDENGDGKTWLQYWVMHASFSYATQYMDQLSKRFPLLRNHWFEFEFYMILWLILPWTDGAAAIYDLWTQPVLVPVLRPLKKNFEGRLATIALSAVNMGHLWFVFGVFEALPNVLKRSCVIIMGIAYPILASVVDLGTATGSVEDNESTHHWLTYWSCISIFFLIMNGMETIWVAHKKLPRIYSLCLAGTIYLMLPLFQGSEVVFRNILVPLFGQREALLVKDARSLARALKRQLPPTRHYNAQKAVAAAFEQEFQCP